MYKNSIFIIFFKNSATFQRIQTLYYSKLPVLSKAGYDKKHGKIFIFSRKMDEKELSDQILGTT